MIKANLNYSLAKSAQCDFVHWIMRKQELTHNKPPFETGGYYVFCLIYYVFIYMIRFNIFYLQPYVFCCAPC